MKSLSFSAKKFCAGVALMSCLAVTGFGNLYSGTITETVTSTNDSAFFVGQIFRGSYQYESDAMDGMFGMPDRNHDQSINTLTGVLINWNPHYDESVVPSLLGGPYCNLTVTGNSVTDFSYDGEYSFGQFWFTESTFDWSGYSPFRTGSRTLGSITFSDPVAVPDSETSTAGLLGVSLLGYAFLRRRLKN